MFEVTGTYQDGVFVPDDRVVLERNPDYWAADNVYLDRVVIKTMKDATALVQVVGRVALLYRPRDDEPTIRLP